MKNVARMGLVAALAVGVLAPAMAQYSKPSGLSVKGGLFFPISNEAKNAAGSDWFGFGVDYELGNLFNVKSDGEVESTFHLSLDYYGDGDFSQVPVMLNYRGRQKNVYWVIGGGLGFVRTPKVGGGTTTNEEFAYNFALGYNFNQGATPYFIEARFLGSNEERLNGFGLYAGLRF
ncbi:MAG TPA: hypothetical protein PLB31_06540 [Fimbriimonadaceae bacterium]|nr:hypothetical protein [Armatimonadota bacterium]HCM73476.1 hypothetical protein [Armatimonadota bacterium]HRD31533.1 hypothetical protein [Fimbriimonadaceae bacterium]HRE94298.1 hypothetical protein [Fimbriimonadaceae bacterium]HRI74115.1 hypothetical protein [Fimbriimonadaceae bacterium]